MAYQIACESVRNGFKSFEEECTKALRYILNELLALGKSNRVQTPDAIARIVGSEGFWTALVQDFRTRYEIALPFSEGCPQLAWTQELVKPQWMIYELYMRYVHLPKRHPHAGGPVEFDMLDHR